MGEQDSTHAAEGPTGSTLALVLDFGDVALSPPVHLARAVHGGQRRQVPLSAFQRFVLGLVAIHGAHKFAVLLKKKHLLL